MFVKLVSNLSFSPGLSSQLTYYLRRLSKENLTRRLAVVFGVLLLGLQMVAIASPAEATVQCSDNDFIRCGLNRTNPTQAHADLVRIWDQNSDGGGHGGFREVFDRFGIGRENLVAMGAVIINSRDHSLRSIGRQAHSSLDVQYNIAGNVIFWRPLYTWGDNLNYPALRGTNRAGQTFYVLTGCGNLVTTFPPVGAPPPPPPPPPAKPVPIPTSPSLSRYKAAQNMTKLSETGQPTNADNSFARPGDTIEYTLTTINQGNGSQESYQPTEDISDILEYADLLDPRGAKLKDPGTLEWAKAKIDPGQTLINQFTVQVKSPLPTTPKSTSDPESFDLRMDNVYGNEIKIPLEVPAPKQIETAAAALPQSGAGTNLIILLAVVSLIVYFYARNRQLITEVGILRSDHQGGK